MAELRRLIPRGIIDSLAVVGTADQIVERLRRLAAAGIEEVIIWPFPKEGQETEEFMAKLARDVLPHVAGT
jgi:alkanesulfonate monooxygenase SsuD/methylene tetrahydromethanopterin reductase-like flavin-dependent oxidoreductase (luciferase family)